MNHEDTDAQKPVTVLKDDGYYFDRLLLRNSSVGHSSRIYYRNPEGVPFQWENHPGTAKNPPENDIIPPLTPPPAVQSLGLPKPRVDQSTGSDRWRWVRFWKKSKKKDCHEKVNNPNRDFDAMRSNEFRDFEFFNSDTEFVGSSASSSSSASSNCPALQTEQGPFVCRPWNITSILVRVARRV